MERANTERHCTRLTNAFSRKIENHTHAVALHFMHYNFVRIHKTLRVTPAMAAGVTKRLWEMSDIVELVDAREANRDRTRGPYKKRNSNRPTTNPYPDPTPIPRPREESTAPLPNSTLSAETHPLHPSFRPPSRNPALPSTQLLN